MKELNVIATIIATINDNDFTVINNSDNDRWFGETAPIRYNAKHRMIRRLAKYSLTIDEWDMWCAN